MKPVGAGISVDATGAVATTVSCGTAIPLSFTKPTPPPGMATTPRGGAAGPGPCMRPPPQVLKDSGAGSAPNKCPYRKLFFSYYVFILKILKIFVENSYLCQSNKKKF